MSLLEMVMEELPELVKLIGNACEPPTVTFPKLTVQGEQTSCEAVWAKAEFDGPTATRAIEITNERKYKRRLHWGEALIVLVVLSTRWFEKRFPKVIGHLRETPR